MSFVWCVATDEEAAVTGNSHQNVPPPVSIDKIPPQENHKPPPEHAAESHKKEKSVLQAKLTKLAIQIGYAGRLLFIPANKE